MNLQFFNSLLTSDAATGPCVVLYNTCVPMMIFFMTVSCENKRKWFVQSSKVAFPVD